MSNSLFTVFTLRERYIYIVSPNLPAQRPQQRQKGTGDLQQKESIILALDEAHMTLRRSVSRLEKEKFRMTVDLEVIGGVHRDSRQTADELEAER